MVTLSRYSSFDGMYLRTVFCVFAEKSVRVFVRVFGVPYLSYHGRKRSFFGLIGIHMSYLNAIIPFIKTNKCSDFKKSWQEPLAFFGGW